MCTRRLTFQGPTATSGPLVRKLGYLVVYRHISPSLGPTFQIAHTDVPDLGAAAS